MKVALIGLGCDKNMINTEQMAYRIREAGHQIVTAVDAADTVVVNTCGFIQSAKEEAIEIILELGELKKEGKIKYILVCGCLAERYKKDIADEMIEGNGFIGVGSFDRVVEALENIEWRPQYFDPPEQQTMEGERMLSTPPGVAYLKIADGCNNRCTYCAIPSIRGRFRSRKMEDIVAEAEYLAQQDVKEIILVAQDTTMYGTDLYRRKALCELLRKLIAVDGIEWIRMLYLYPDKLTDDLIDLIAAEPKLIPYIEMPIQHSEKSVLKRMHRPGDHTSLLTLIENIRAKIPNAVLRTTLIAGFPGESEKEFEGLCNFVRQAEFDKLGVFPFSAEEGTKAAAMKEQIPKEIALHRAEVIEDIQSEISFQKVFDRLDETVRVLCEGFDRIAECYYGRSYAEAPDIDGKIFFTSKVPVQAGQFVTVHLTEQMDFDLIGEVVQ